MASRPLQSSYGEAVTAILRTVVSHFDDIATVNCSICLLERCSAHSVNKQLRRRYEQERRDPSHSI